MGYWADTAKRVIREVHQSLPATATLAERMRAIDAAYPFGERAYSPYKTWLKARREYLYRYGYQSKGKPIHESPMERMMRIAQVGRIE